MKELGFRNLTELEGGMLKWRNSGVQQTAAVEAKGMTKNDFEKLINSDKKVLVDFNATWCGPCRKMGPYLDKMKEEFKGKGIAIVKIDVDENPTLSSELKIDGIPHLMLFENGKKVWENVGYLPEEEVRKHL
jgi:thioredoxin